MPKRISKPFPVSLVHRDMSPTRVVGGKHFTFLLVAV